MTTPFPEPTLDSPFTVHLAVKCDMGDAVNASNINSLAIAFASTEESEQNRYMLHGQQSIAIGELTPEIEKVVRIELVALVPGVLRVTGLAVVDTTRINNSSGEGGVVSKVPPIELFVKSPTRFNV